jgi:hypothetical protein
MDGKDWGVQASTKGSITLSHPLRARQKTLRSTLPGSHRWKATTRRFGHPTRTIYHRHVMRLLIRSTTRHSSDATTQVQGSLVRGHAFSHGHTQPCAQVQGKRGRNGLRYYSPTGIPSHTAHRIKSRGKKGEQEGQCKLAHSPASDVEKGHTSRRALTGDVQEGVFEDWHLRSGSIGARALNPITAGPLPATLLGPLASHSNHQQTHCTSARK